MITPERRAGAWYARGLTVGGKDEFRLGTKLFRVAGTHWVAFDDGFAAPVMRAFYDPEDAPFGLPAFEHLGYVQEFQVLFNGTPIPPWEFNPRLKDRERYIVEDPVRSGDGMGDDEDPPRQYWCVDMMGPGQLWANGVTDPFYALNGMLQFLLPETRMFYEHPKPNGSLLPEGEEDPPSYRSRYATIFADVCVELLTPEHVQRLIAGLDPIEEVPGVAGEEPFQTVIAALLTDTGPVAPGPVDPWDPPVQLATDAVPDDQITVRAVGDYVLIGLPDREDFGPTLVIPPVTKKVRAWYIPVYLASPYDLEATMGRVTTETLERIWDYQVDHYQVSERRPRPAGRGRGGLDRSPYDLDPDAFVVEIVYRTILAGKPAKRTRATHLTAISAFTWSVLMQYDENSGTLEVTGVREPAETDAPGLDAIGKRITDLSQEKYQEELIDTSYFTAAGVRRDGYSTPRTLRYLPRAAKDATSADAVGYTGSGS